MGRGNVVTWEDLFMEEFTMREGNFHENRAGFSNIAKKNVKHSLL